MSQLYVLAFEGFLALLLIIAIAYCIRLDGNTYLDGRAIRLGNFTPVHVMLESRKE